MSCARRRARAVAEDWLKIRKVLSRHPKVVQMAGILSVHRREVVGGLVDAWGLFDTYSTDGVLQGYSLSVLADAISWPGGPEAMQAVEWLQVLPDGGVLMPRFDTHNGESAKKRAEDAERQRLHRLSQKARDNSGTEPGQKPRPEEDKRKKKIKNTGQQAGLCERFVEFWKLFPARPGTSKTNKKGCLTKWRARGLDALADVILADVRLRIAHDSQWLRGFPPNPETYLNQDRWDDGFSASLPKAGVGPVEAPTEQQAAQYRIEQAAQWATNMRELGHATEEEIAEQLERIERKFGPIARGERQPHAG